MLLELLASTILWVGIDLNHDAKLEVACDKVTLDYGGDPTARDKVVTFWMQDLRHDHTHIYGVAMPVDVHGRIVLEPAKFWVEEIRQQKNLTIRVGKFDYYFELNGTYKSINCN